ncbi:hypothetical protein F7725_007166 [Dissostichus mawsoni]|uniref:G domain-containing protein n=1 Tax=Dissostichus mawsoni TaxID=36200 RepID=A0A7J5XW06_DISMA|nr:hypothetical protein F7725_007166 [Dissostichus mawsoni]
MALRLCSWVLRDSSSSRDCSSGLLDRKVRHGSAVCSRGRRNGFIFTPACFITSDAFLNRLMKGKAVEADGSSYRLPASVLPDSAEQLSLLMRHPDQPGNAKVLKVALIGAPNAGKSTLSNQLLGKRSYWTLLVSLLYQRHHLEKALLEDPWNTVKEADIVVVLVDVSDRWMCGRLDFEVLKCLAQHTDIPAILVLNKVDLLKTKDRLLDITAELTCGVVNGRKLRVRTVIKPPKAEKRSERQPEPSPDEDTAGLEGDADPSSALSREQLKALRSQQGWAHFKDVFMLSSVDKEDVDTLKNYFMVAAKPGSWQYHSEVLTDQTPEQICTNTIREKLLENLPQEVPYTITQRMVIGAGGQMVGRMAREAGEDLSRVFLRDVRLKLSAKLKV